MSIADDFKRKMREAESARKPSIANPWDSPEVKAVFTAIGDILKGLREPQVVPPPPEEAVDPEPSTAFSEWVPKAPEFDEKYYEGILEAIRFNLQSQVLRLDREDIELILDLVRRLSNDAAFDDPSH